MEAQNAFQQLRMRFTDPIQHDYEVIRPIVLFGERDSERSAGRAVFRRQGGASDVRPGGDEGRLCRRGGGE